MALPTMKHLLLAAILSAGLAQAAGGSFVPLFDGKTLKGWEVCNGFAKYRVEAGAIVGTTAEGSPNSFLCTQKEYGDFVLEFDVKVDPALNSGVQIRSHRYPKDETVTVYDGKAFVQQKHSAGRFYGYQVEIANEESHDSGGIYDEARRGWLHNIADDPAASKALKDNQWNHYKVEAIGDRMRVWLNGIACADLTDPLDQSGFIGLQVHQYEGKKPAEVRWRNIRIQDLGRHAWTPVWDGKSLDGWKKQGGGSFTVEDGAIRAHSVDGDPGIGMLLSDRSFQDLTVRLRFKMTKGNSGFFVRTDPSSMAAYEVEIDEAKGTGGFWETGPAGRKWVTGPVDNGAARLGEWNELTASLHGHRIVFHVNGVKTLELLNDTPGRLEGRLGLQTHGSKRPTEIWFRDIEVLAPQN